MIGTVNEVNSFDISAFIKADNQKRQRTKREIEIFNEWPYNLVEVNAANKKIKDFHAKLWPSIQQHLPKRKRALPYADKQRIDKLQLSYSERLTRALIEISFRAGCTAVDRNKDKIEQCLIDIQDAFNAAGLCEICLSEKGGKHLSRMIPLLKFTNLISEDPWDYKAPIDYYFELRQRKKVKRDKPVLLPFNKSVDAIAAIQLENKIINDAHAKMYIGYEPEFGNGRKARVRPVFKTIGTATNSNELPTKKNCRNYASHQNLKVSERRTIYFDAESNFDADYSALFISMIYHRAGMKITGDPYWLWEEQFDEHDNKHLARRQLTKLTINTLINAKTELEALASLENEARWFVSKAGGVKGKKPTTEYKAAIRLQTYLKLTGVNFQQLIELVKIKHAAIADIAFGHDLGIKLMAIEGKIARRVALHFCEKGRPCLSTHDGLQVCKSDGPELIEVMRREYFKLFYQYPRIKYDGMELIQNISHISSKSNSISSLYHPHNLRKIRAKKTSKHAKYLQKRADEMTTDCGRPENSCRVIRSCGSQDRKCGNRKLPYNVA